MNTLRIIFAYLLIIAFFVGTIAMPLYADNNSCAALDAAAAEAATAAANAEKARELAEAEKAKKDKNAEAAKLQADLFQAKVETAKAAVDQARIDYWYTYDKMIAVDAALAAAALLVTKAALAYAATLSSLTTAEALYKIGFISTAILNSIKERAGLMLENLAIAKDKVAKLTSDLVDLHKEVGQKSKDLADAKLLEEGLGKQAEMVKKAAIKAEEAAKSAAKAATDATKKAAAAAIKAAAAATAAAACHAGGCR